MLTDHWRDVQEQMNEMFVRMDSNKDGIVSKEEAKLEIKNQMQQQQQQQGGAPPGEAPQGGQVKCYCYCTLLLLRPLFPLLLAAAAFAHRLLTCSRRALHCLAYYRCRSDSQPAGRSQDTATESSKSNSAHSNTDAIYLIWHSCRLFRIGSRQS